MLRVRIQCLLVLFIYNDFILKIENYIDNEITYAACWPLAALKLPNAQQYSDCSHTLTHAHALAFGLFLYCYLACWCFQYNMNRSSQTTKQKKNKKQKTYIVWWNELYGFWTDAWHWHTLLVLLGCHFCDDIFLLYVCMPLLLKYRRAPPEYRHLPHWRTALFGITSWSGGPWCIQFTHHSVPCIHIANGE